MLLHLLEFIAELLIKGQITRFYTSVYQFIIWSIDNLTISDNLHEFTLTIKIMTNKRKIIESYLGDVKFDFSNNKLSGSLQCDQNEKTLLAYESFKLFNYEEIILQSKLAKSVITGAFKYGKSQYNNEKNGKMVKFEKLSDIKKETNNFWGALFLVTIVENNGNEIKYKGIIHHNPETNEVMGGVGSGQPITMKEVVMLMN